MSLLFNQLFRSTILQRAAAAAVVVVDFNVVVEYNFFLLFWRPIDAVVVIAATVAGAGFPLC